MASLLALPCELSFQIIKLLEIGDKIHLSATCKSYRAQLLPEVFNTIRFTSDEASAASALAAIEAYGQYTNAIEFTCQCDRDDQPTTPSLPPAACKVLKGDLTPTLRTVTLKFDFGFDDYGLHDYDDFFDDVEDANTVRHEETRKKWRALMNETWEALGTNTLVRELILDELPPRWTSAYYTDAFGRFLNQLESATIRIFGMQDYAGWRTIRSNSCRDFLSNLDTAFFRHMRGLNHLYIRASDPLGLGDQDSPYIELALNPEDLPLLQALTLENCFVSPELVLFIKSHAQVLKSLHFNESFCGRNLSWADFFDQIYKAKPSLAELVYRDNKAPFMEGEREMWVPDQSALERVRQRLEADSTLNVFRQGYLDADEGVLFFDDGEDVMRFDKGDDQRAYVRLMGLVNENRAEAKLDSGQL